MTCKRNWMIDGVALDDPAGRWQIRLESPPPSPAQRNVARLQLTRRDGAVSKRLSWATSQQTFHLIVRDVAGEVEDNADVLIGVLARAQVLTRKFNGATRSMNVVESVISEPDRVTADYWRLSATLTLDPFWREGALVTSAPVPVPGEVVFPEWAGTTGDVQDGVLRVQGPLVEFSAVAVDGTGVSFAHSVSAAQYVFVDVARFRGWRGGASSWSPNSPPVLLDYPAGGPLRLSPTTAGISLSVAAVGATSSTVISLRASKWWL